MTTKLCPNLKEICTFRIFEKFSLSNTNSNTNDIIFGNFESSELNSYADQEKVPTVVTVKICVCVSHFQPQPIQPIQPAQPPAVGSIVTAFFSDTPPPPSYVPVYSTTSLVDVLMVVINTTTWKYVSVVS